MGLAGAAILLLGACAAPPAEPAATPPPPTAAPPTSTATATLAPPTATPLPQPPTLTSVPLEQAATDAPPTAEPTTFPSATPTPGLELGGIPLEQIVVVPAPVVDHMRAVFVRGQTIGRYAHRFSKLGDSVIANGDFLTRFDSPGSYTLGPYESLQPVIDHYRGSWVRFGVGIRIGLHAWGVFDPMWANKEWCEPNEAMIDCEFRLNNPAVVLIHLGSNDTTDSYPQFLRRVIEETLEAGIIPVIMTKADRFEGEDNRNNETMRALAAEFQVPLLDFDIIAQTLPNRGLKKDNVHMDGPLQHDYNLSEAMEKGHSVHNLVVLFMLETLLHEVIAPPVGGQG